MKDLFLNKSMKLIQEHHSPYSDDDIELLKYGLEGLYLTITKLVVIVFLALLLGMLKEVAILLLLFNVIRFSGFGVHASDSKTCLITSTLFFIAIPYFLLHIAIPNYVTYIICGCCILSYILYAPADTKKRPLNNPRKRMIRKLTTVFWGILFTSAIVFINSFVLQKMFLGALIIQMIIILPITYRILGLPYRNWAKQ